MLSARPYPSYAFLYPVLYSGEAESSDYHWGSLLSAFQLGLGMGGSNWRLKCERREVKAFTLNFHILCALGHISWQWQVPLGLHLLLGGPVPCLQVLLDLVNIISSPCLFKCRGGAGSSLLIVSMFSTLLAGSFHFAHASVDYFFIKVWVGCCFLSGSWEIQFGNYLKAGTVYNHCFEPFLKNDIFWAWSSAGRWRY